MDGSADGYFSAMTDVVVRTLPMLGMIVLVALCVWWLDRWFARRPRRLNRPGSMLGVTLLGTLLVVLTAPVEDTTRAQLVGLYGLALTAVIALSSTTFVSNAMAGLMLRSLRNFSVGDFIRVEEHFGRVSERGLFHTEIQTEDRDLTTLPNLLLATRPTTVVRASGTIISARVSLGYDTPRSAIEAALMAGAASAGLDDPFVQVVELGDFAVVYRVAGFLPEVKQLVSVRSRLRAKAMDALHEAGIEIVSPAYMNQRRADGKRMLPPQARPAPAEEPENVPEDVIFDKADAAEAIATHQHDLDTLRGEIADLEKTIKDTPAPERDPLKAELERMNTRAERIARAIELQRSAVEEGPGEARNSR